ncbi:MAG TPA: hypothetical protein VLC98_00765 [Phnomibacter sp.]|nr:hypothetical protein [Phnomibacter sp.]
MPISPFIPPPLLPVKVPGLSSLPSFDISILRLDQLHPIISGNKWLKLEGWLQQAALAHRHGIFTAGGPWSNHIHAAAAWAYLHEVPFHAVIKGKSAQRTPMLQDVLEWNGKIEWVNHSEFNKEQHWQQVADKANLQWIPMGGDGAPGEAGVTQFFNRFANYSFDEIWCAIGTGTTVAGIAASAIGAKKIVAFDPGIGDEQVYTKLKGIEQQLPHRSISIVQTRLGKFGSVSAELVDSMNRFFIGTGIPTDRVYTGKMIHAFMEELLLPINCEKRSILLVHTGGLQGNRSLPADSLKFMGW